MKPYFYLPFLLFLFVQLSAQPTPKRYETSVFSKVSAYRDLIYQKAIPFSFGQKEILTDYQLDFYEPSGDAVLQRPLILLLDDGGFVYGNYRHSSVVAMCDSLVRKGYTCACVEYRQGLEDASNLESQMQALYRAVQDVRAVVRYFKEFATTFRIDPNKVFVGGIKTGATIALNAALMRTDNDIPFAAKDLGCLDCSGNPFEQSVAIAGVLNIDGGISDPNLLLNNPSISILNITQAVKESFSDKENPTLFMDFEEAVAYPFGALQIHQLMDSLGLDSEFHADFNDEESKIFGYVHPSIFDYCTRFLSKHLTFKTPTPQGSAVVCEHSTTTFQVPTSPQSHLEWQVTNGNIEAQTNNTIQVKWNKGGQTGTVMAMEINAAGVTGSFSDPFSVQIQRQPRADYDLQYLNGNTIQIIDRSAHADFVTFDLGFQGEVLRSRPNASNWYTYPQNGTFFVTQTSEGACGVVTQTFPVEVEVSADASRLHNFIQIVPSLMKTGAVTNLPIEPIKSYNSLIIKVLNETGSLIVDKIYELKNNTTGISLETEKLSDGTYFIQVVAGNQLATKRLIVQ